MTSYYICFDDGILSIAKEPEVIIGAFKSYKRASAQCLKDLKKMEKEIQNRIKVIERGDPEWIDMGGYSLLSTRSVKC